MHWGTFKDVRGIPTEVDRWPPLGTVHAGGPNSSGDEGCDRHEQVQTMNDEGGKRTGGVLQPSSRNDT